METYTLNVAGLQRELPKVKIHDELTIASFVMFGDTELIERCAESLTTKFNASLIDYFVCPEAKAIPLIHACSRIMGVNYIVIRKSVKGYMTDPITEKVQSITTIGEQNLVLDKIDVDKIKGKNVAIIDDVVSTGGSISSVEKLLDKVGANVTCKAAVLLEEAGYENPDLIYLEKLPVFKS
jgi:adenine phosphoribosyltransferase